VRTRTVWASGKDLFMSIIENKPKNTYLPNRMTSPTCKSTYVFFST